MIVYNLTDIPMQFRTKIVTPDNGVEFPDITSEQSLTADEKVLLEDRVLSLGERRPGVLRRKMMFEGRDFVPASALTWANFRTLKRGQ